MYSRIKLLLGCSVVAWVGGWCAAAPLPADEVHLSHVEKSAHEWIVVRLETPLVPTEEQGQYSITTGRAELDHELLAAGVWRIEHALPVSAAAAKPGSRFLSSPLSRTYRLFVPPDADIELLAQRLRSLRGVERAGPEGYSRGTAVPNDPFFPDQWHLDQSSDHDIDAPEAWDISHGSGIIAVLDTGADLNHEDLDGAFLSGYDFINGDADPTDDHLPAGHGTGMSSIAAAWTNNGTGIAGTAPGPWLLPVKVLDSTNWGPICVTADGLVWATDQGADVVNMSLVQDFETSCMRDAIDYAHAAGVVQIATTGNDGQNLTLWPGAHADVIAVGATGPFDVRWSSSNYGSHIDLVAPGESILRCGIDDTYWYSTGTSPAAPQVAGTASLIRELLWLASPREVRHLLQSGAEDEVGLPAEDTPGFDPYHGWGRLNAHRSVAAAQSALSLRVEKVPVYRVFLETVNPVAQSFDFIRGNLASLGDAATIVDLGTVSCLENDSADAEVTGAPIDEDPEPHQGYFYLARFTSVPGSGSYGGGTSLRKDREATAGDCSP